MPLFEADAQTEAIVIYTEPGGRMEAQLVDWREANDSRLPIVAFMAGRFMDDEEMKGMSFGHAGTIVEGKEDTGDREDRPPRGRRDPGGRAHRRDPRPRPRGPGGRELMAAEERKHGVFIDVEVDEAAASDPELAAKLAEVCPVDIFADEGGRVATRRGEPRRVRALRALHRGRAPPAPSASRSSTTAPS